MEIFDFPAHMNEVHRDNFGCEFCPRVSSTIADQNEHVLSHFDQEICTKCDQNLLRIGGNLYVLHGAITCINIKQETISDEQNEVVLSCLHDDANFHTVFECSGENDEDFDEERKFNGVIDPIKNVELSPTADFESKFTTSADVNERTCHQTESQNMSLDEVKIELNEEIAECDPMTKKQPENIDELAGSNLVTVKQRWERLNEKVECDIDGCGVIVTRKSQPSHIARKHSGNSFECDICEKSFPSIGQIRQHMISHEDGKKYGCEKCGSKNLTKRSLLRHHIKHSFICSECSQAFCLITQLKEHYQIHHQEANPYDAIDTRSKRTIGVVYAEKKVKNIKCPVEGCGELLSSVSRRRHMAAKHSTKRFECDICQRSFTTLHIIRNHMIVHGAKTKLYTCKLCGASNITKYTLKNRHQKQKYVCPVCDKPFCQKSGLKKHHIDEHCGGKVPIKQSELNKKIERHKCPIEGCNELLSSNNRRYHIATKHTKIKAEQSECNICKKKFANKYVMKLHILRVHEPSSKKFKCNLCESAFLSKGSLEWHHKIVHLKERNFMCSECGKTFVQKGQLIIHITKHTGEKPYACSFEGCSKRFRTQTARQEHSRSHTGEKPYRCDVEGCDRRFAYPVDVKRHKFSAHGIFFKKYPCQICSEIFPENMLLKKHMKKHENQI